LKVPPGITDLSSLSFRDEEFMFQEGSIEEQYIRKILPGKLNLSLKYAQTRTFNSDLNILFRTVLGFKPPHSSREVERTDARAPYLSKMLSRNSS
jgi:lipopolysaccharide/colanic/teichoic acid biosynthesis glycosyltransferase